MSLQSLKSLEKRIRRLESRYGGPQEMDMTWEGIQRAFAAACPVEARQRAETDPKMRRILETVERLSVAQRQHLMRTWEEVKARQRAWRETEQSAAAAISERDAGGGPTDRPAQKVPSRSNH
jgi:hypothetical protein